MRQQQKSASSLASGHDKVADQARAMAESIPAACDEIAQRLANTSATAQEQQLSVELKLNAFAASLGAALQGQRDTVLEQVMQTCTSLLDGMVNQMAASVADTVRDTLSSSAATCEMTTSQLACSSAATAKLAEAANSGMLAITTDSELCREYASGLEAACGGVVDSTQEQIKAVQSAAESFRETSSALEVVHANGRACEAKRAAAWETAAEDVLGCARAVCEEGVGVMEQTVAGLQVSKVAAGTAATAIQTHTLDALSCTQLAANEVSACCVQVCSFRQCPAQNLQQEVYDTF